jgi:putative SOS response-associated peptidase YedK
MCGRYVSVSSPTILAERFKVEEVRVTETEANYNVAPRADVPVVAESKGRRTLDLVRWGLVPSWAKDLSIGDRMINARAEKITTSNAYKRAFERRRCIIPADGFYEWEPVPRDESEATEGERSAESTRGQRDESAATEGEPTRGRRGGKKVKQPWFFRRRDGEPLAFAGLWEIWHDPKLGDDAPRIRTCVIITTDANDLVRPVHDRMPVVLAEREWSTWLDRDNHDVSTLQELLVPAPPDEFETWPVSTLVNKADNNSPELLDPVPVASS